MKSYLVEVSTGPIAIEGDSLEEVIDNVREQILDGRLKLLVSAERTYSDNEAAEDFEPEESLVGWKIGQDIAGMIQEAGLAGVN